MMATQQRLTEAQEHMIGALDDAHEHLFAEWDKPGPHSVGTCGFAHIGNIDGRCSFVQRIKSLADSDNPHVRYKRGRNEWSISVGALDLRLSPRSRLNGYRLSITNIAELVGGPAHQRLDVRKELHRLFLERLQCEWGYLSNARVHGRVD